MCLIGVNLQPKVAEEDIVCYKIITKNLRSWYYEFRYKIGKTYRNENEIHVIKNYIMTREDDLDCINQGFHSYVNITDWINEYRYFETVKSTYGNALLAKCIIPKGSVYYVGKDNAFASKNNSYVSNRIKILETIPFLEYIEHKSK